VIILAIDPGNADSGWVIYDKGKVLDSGVHSNAEMLRAVQQSYGTVDALAIEMMRARGMPVSNDEMETLVWIGRYQQAFGHPEEVLFAYRQEVKLHLCGSARAKDPNVRQALIDRIGKPGTKKNPGPTYGVTSHAWPALAVAVYVADMNPEARHAITGTPHKRSTLRRRTRL
jgi:hypothetical protein